MLLDVSVNRPLVVSVAPALTDSVPLKRMGEPDNAVTESITKLPVPLMPLPLLVILPFMLIVMPVVFSE